MGCYYGILTNLLFSPDDIFAVATGTYPHLAARYKASLLYKTAITEQPGDIFRT